jgi:lipopolysaccharide/colanic/teichoic acid biosynthesis glycosyltransferase
VSTDVAARVAGLIERDVAVAFRESPAYRRRQRAFDLTVGLAAIVATSPVLGLAALAIWLEDRGPILFKQGRVGRYGRIFTIYKLRTMRLDDCGDALSPTASTDRRITRVGRVLRRLSIDELPQLFNVVRGDMSIVGPRPEMPFVVRRYERWQHLRHLRKPGITGLWQISCRSTIPLHRPEATKIDLEYVRTASTRTDGRIFLKTFVALLSTQGAY